MKIIIVTSLYENNDEEVCLVGSSAPLYETFGTWYLRKTDEFDPFFQDNVVTFIVTIDFLYLISTHDDVKPVSYTVHTVLGLYNRS